MTKLQIKMIFYSPTQNYFMAKDTAPYESPYRIKKKKIRADIVKSNNDMKKDPRNSTSEWRRQLALEDNVSEYTIMYYLRNRNK